MRCQLHGRSELGDNYIDDLFNISKDYRRVYKE